MGIHAIWGPPRSGKTTLTIDLAYAISMRGHSVCIVSTERYGELSGRMGIQIKKERSLSAIADAKESVKHIVVPVDDLLYVLAEAYDTDAFGEELSAEKSKKLLEEMSNIFDYVLVDCPARCDSNLAAWAMSLSDSVITITGDEPADALWHRAFKRAVDTVRMKQRYVSVEVNPDFDYRSFHRALGVYPETWVPFFQDASTVQTDKHTLYGSNGKAGKKYSEGIDEVVSLVKEGEER